MKYKFSGNNYQSKPVRVEYKPARKIKAFIGGKNNVDLTISLNEYDPSYADSLSGSIKEAESSENLLTFTMEEFMNYTPGNKK